MEGITTCDTEDFSVGVVFVEPEEEVLAVFFIMTVEAAFVEDIT